MAGTAQISSSFVITFNPSNTVATTIAVPRACNIIGVGVTNTTGSARDVTLTDGAANNITNGGAYSAADNTTSWADLDLTNNSIGPTDNLICTCANAGLEVYILCVASGGGQALTAT